MGSRERICFQQYRCIAANRALAATTERRGLAITRSAKDPVSNTMEQIIISGASVDVNLRYVCNHHKPEVMLMNIP